MDILLITLAALAHLASGYVVNAGFIGVMEYIYPGVRLSMDKFFAATNMLFGPLGFIVLGLHWYEHGRQPFRWDWPRLLINEGDR